MWKLLWIWSGPCGKTSSIVTDVLLKSTVLMNWSPNSGSHLAAYVWSLMGGSAVETPLCPAFTVTGCLEVKGWAKVRRVGFEGEEEEEEWPSGCVSPSPRTRIHLSNSSGPHTETDSSLTFHSLSFDMGCLCSDSTGGESWLSLYWNYSSVDLAQIWDPEAAEISGTGYRSDKILFFFFVLDSRDLAYTEVRPSGK